MKRRVDMTINDNIYHNFVEYFAKNHLSFAEPQDFAKHSLRNTGIMYIKKATKYVLAVYWF